MSSVCDNRPFGLRLYTWGAGAHAGRRLRMELCSENRAPEGAQVKKADPVRLGHEPQIGTVRSHRQVERRRSPVHSTVVAVIYRAVGRHLEVGWVGGGVNLHGVKEFIRQPR